MSKHLGFSFRFTLCQCFYLEEEVCLLMWQTEDGILHQVHWDSGTWLGDRDAARGTRVQHMAWQNRQGQCLLKD